jgi:hypothetical protein
MKNVAGKNIWFVYFILLPGMYYLPLIKKKKRKKLNIINKNIAEQID